ncbi:MAG TPA: NAD(P)/FAD-dependent oxidoreductase, partial [Thermoanaerobaculia bacterium]|nr:NAD(P)/FAD-dependent oxidoreductase [Thermoanaerobaculia bacterium]
YKALLDGLEAADELAAGLAGEAAAPDGYAAAVASRFEDYLEVRNYFYGIERRWPAAPFWRRRRERQTVY